MAPAAAAAPATAPSRRPRPAPRRKPKPRQAPRSRQRPRQAAAGRPKMTVYKSHSPRLVAQNAAGLIPVAAGRTAVAVRELPDSNAIVRLTQGQLWIGVLGALLVGIVALNVVSLGLNASSGRVSEQIDQLNQQNSALRADIAEKLSSTKVQNAAAALGLSVPNPQRITYLNYNPSNLSRAAKLLAGLIVASAAPSSTQTSASAPASTATSIPSSTSSKSAAATTKAPSTTPAPTQAPPAAPSHSAPASSGGGGVSAGL